MLCQLFFELLFPWFVLYLKLSAILETLLVVKLLLAYNTLLWRELFVSYQTVLCLNRYVVIELHLIVIYLFSF